jgi:acyl-CoA dehydrogenase
MFIIGHGMCGPTLMAYATEEHKRRYLPPLASGEEVWCQLFSEPVAGSDLAGLRTAPSSTATSGWSTARRSGPRARTTATTGSWSPAPTSVAKHKGLTCSSSTCAPGHRGAADPTGQRRVGFNEVYFTDVRIPDHQRLGAVGDGWAVSLTTLMNERCRSALDAHRLPRAAPTSLRADTAPKTGARSTTPRCASSSPTGRCAPAGLRYTAYRSITALSKGQMPGPENSIGKLVAGTTLQEIASFALDLQGQCGVLVDHGDPRRASSRRCCCARRPPASRAAPTRSCATSSPSGCWAAGDVRVDRDVAFKKA